MDSQKIVTALNWLKNFDAKLHPVVKQIASDPSLHDRVPGIANIATEVSGVLDFFESLAGNPIPA